ncbi:MAG: UDP-N-acetylmuramate dehydrogenase [Ruminococcus sp.]|nr:UDP-N-acetylmuramate dehydrogenase [Ruminococcus sp.]
MEQIDQLECLCRQYDCPFLRSEPLRKHTTFRIGGSCQALVDIGSSEALQALVSFCNENGIRWTVLGNGSNMLVSDEGYDGVVFLVGKRMARIEIREDCTVYCEAGALLMGVARTVLEESLSGMECLAGIPGTIGGALYMNAGAYGGEMADIVVSAEYLDEDGTLKNMAKEDMELSYRHSVFSGTKRIITGVTLQLCKGTYDTIRTEMEGYLSQRRAKQPLELPSAGSTFKRPVGSYASLLIDQCGLKGASVGDAQVSVKHAGFVVNTGKATCKDVLELCDYVIETVREKTGYQLELEPVVLR